MPVSGAAIANSLNALRLYSRRVDQAASRVSSVGLFAVPPEQTQEARQSPARPRRQNRRTGRRHGRHQVAQRAFAAQIRCAGPPTRC